MTNRWEFRVAGRLSDRAKESFEGMDVVDAPTETIIRGVVGEDSDLRAVLALLRDLGLQVVAMNEVPD